MREFIATGGSAITIMRVHPIEKIQAIRSSLPVRRKSGGGAICIAHFQDFLCTRAHFATEQRVAPVGNWLTPTQQRRQPPKSYDRWPPRILLTFSDLCWAATRAVTRADVDSLSLQQGPTNYPPPRYSLLSNQ